MVKCPQCKNELVRYVLRTRKPGTHIAVQCEACGYVGPEFLLAHMNDTSAALSAVRAFNSKPARTSARVFLITERHRLQ